VRAERLLPIACVAAAALLAGSELMTAFHFTPPGGEPLCAQQAADRHYYAPFVLAIFAMVAVVVAVATNSKPAAAAVAVAGGIALLIFLTIDLPDANNVGTLGTSCGPAVTDLTAKAEPQSGFWLEMIGALGLALSGAALATLTPEQLGSLRSVRIGRPRHLDHATALRSADAVAAGDDPPAGEPSAEEPDPHRRPRDHREPGRPTRSASSRRPRR
jgi:hypothetical protein